MLSGADQKKLQQKSKELFDKVLKLNPEWADAHFGLFQLYSAMGSDEEQLKANHHKTLHAKYKADDSAHDTVIAKARAKSAAADHAANLIAIYELNKLEGYQTVNQFIKQYNIEKE